MIKKYLFSGHETFPCRNLWLKKGYDFIMDDGDFNNPDAVVSLGVGKNMVNSIRFWLRSFGMTRDDKLTAIATRLLADDGWDPYCEDAATLWLLHYMLVKTDEASLYKMTFVDFHRGTIEFDKGQLQKFVEGVCRQDSYAVNSGTLVKDINVMMQNYVYPSNISDPERFSNLLIELRLIQFLEREGRTNEKPREVYGFADVKAEDIIEEIIMFALLDYKGGEKVLSNDALSEIALIFCMTEYQLIAAIKHLVEKYPKMISYTDNSGIRNVQITGTIDKMDVLDDYYRR